MGAQALAIERLLAQGLAQKKSALGSPGARLQRASELAPEAASALPTAVAALDRLLPGGLPRGRLVELSGRRSSGRFSLGLAALAATTSSGQAAALVDLGDHLDPETAERAGVDLRCLLWARPRRAKEALAAAEMLLAAGFPLVVADLGLSHRTRWVPDAAWVRLARSAAAQGATLLLSTPRRASGIAADAVVSAAGARAVWRGSGTSPRLLAGLSARLTLEKRGRATPGAKAPLRLRAPEIPGGEGRPLALLRDAGDSRKAVEPRVEAQEARDPLALHDGEVKRIPRGQPGVPEHDAFGALDVGKLDRVDPIDDAEQRVEGGLDRVATIDRRVPVEDLLQDFDVRREPFPLREGPLEQPLGVALVRVRRADEIHRDVRIDEDHRGGASW